MILKFQIIGLITIVMLSNCSNKKIAKNESRVIDSTECKKIYKKYNEKFLSEENDSALFYIDKAIKCDPKNNNYKFIRIQFLVLLKKYDKAIIGLDEIKGEIIDPAIKMQKGVLLLKINDLSFKKNLEESYNEFKQISKPTSSNLLYKIALDNFFIGKDYSLNEVNKFKETFKGKAYENQNISALEELIKKESKENVLYNLFSITD